MSFCMLFKPFFAVALFMSAWIEIMEDIVQIPGVPLEKINKIITSIQQRACVSHLFSCSK